MRKLAYITWLFVVLLSSCGGEHEAHHEIKKLMVTKPIQRDTVITQEYVCQIKSINHIELRSQERGYVEQIFVDEGQFVQKGQKLFQIMPRLYQAEYERKKAEARVAEIEYLNTKNLADSNIVSQNELAMKEASFLKAKAELALAEVHLDFTEIKAPFSGIIDRFHIRLGSLVDEGELLTNLSDNTKMWVYFNVSESQYLDYQQNINKTEKMKVLLKMANNQMFPYPGIVETIEADFNNETGNIPFRATFLNPKGLLRHGETGSILTDKKYKNAIIIPQKATFEILDKKYVFVVTKENIVEQRQIEISAEMQDLFVIESGLGIDEQILLEGLRKVKHGDQIECDYKEPSEVIANLKLYAE